MRERARIYAYCQVCVYSQCMNGAMASCSTIPNFLFVIAAAAETMNNREHLLLCIATAFFEPKTCVVLRSLIALQRRIPGTSGNESSGSVLINDIATKCKWNNEMTVHSAILPLCRKLFVCMEPRDVVGSSSPKQACYISWHIAMRSIQLHLSLLRDNVSIKTKQIDQIHELAMRCPNELCTKYNQPVDITRIIGDQQSSSGHYHQQRQQRQQFTCDSCYTQNTPTTLVPFYSPDLQLKSDMRKFNGTIVLLFDSAMKEQEKDTHSRINEQCAIEEKKSKEQEKQPVSSTNAPMEIIFNASNQATFENNSQQLYDDTTINDSFDATALLYDDDNDDDAIEPYANDEHVTVEQSTNGSPPSSMEQRSTTNEFVFLSLEEQLDMFASSSTREQLNAYFHRLTEHFRR